MLFSPKRPPDYGDDFFAESRMSFGDHIDELRTHLIRALLGLLVVLVGGGLLDMIGIAVGNRNIGLGIPMVDVIVNPLKSMLQDYYAKQNLKSLDKFRQALEAQTQTSDLERVQKKLADNENNLAALTQQERLLLAGTLTEMPMVLPVEPFAKLWGPPKDASVTEFAATVKLYPAQLEYLATRGQIMLGSRQYVTTLSAQEGMVVYFKVLLLSSFVIASPWVFYQIWAFVAAGLYPHERAYVYKFLGPSIGLFLSGVFLCQFFVLPAAVKALLGFNDTLNLEPDIRLAEWLGFALLLPLVFGVAFQTPLVMFFFNRIGTFTAADYWAKWRVAVMVLAAFSAIITPTPDVVTMLSLFLPMFGLYVIGVLVCYYFPPEHEQSWKEEEQQVAV